MLDSTTVLPSKCSPNAYSLNLIIIFCTNPRAFEDCGVDAAENLQTPSHCPARCPVNGFSGQAWAGAWQRVSDQGTVMLRRCDFALPGVAAARCHTRNPPRNAKSLLPGRAFF